MSAHLQLAFSSRFEHVREANDHIARKAEQYRFVSPIPLLCECSDSSCDEIILMTLDRYRRARREGHVLASGHAAGAR
jgi:hypothetical protein